MNHLACYCLTAASCAVGLSCSTKPQTLIACSRCTRGHRATGGAFGFNPSSYGYSGAAAANCERGSVHPLRSPATVWSSWKHVPTCLDQPRPLPEPPRTTASVTWTARPTSHSFLRWRKETTPWSWRRPRAGLAWWECDALQEGGRGQVRPSRVHPCAAAATAASSSTGNIPPDPSDATAKHGPCLIWQRPAFSYSQVPVMILQSDSSLAKIKTDVVQDERFWSQMSLVSTLLMVIFLVRLRRGGSVSAVCQYWWYVDYRNLPELFFTNEAGVFPKPILEKRSN